MNKFYLGNKLINKYCVGQNSFDFQCNHCEKDIDGDFGCWEKEFYVEGQTEFLGIPKTLHEPAIKVETYCWGDGFDVYDENDPTCYNLAAAVSSVSMALDNQIDPEACFNGAKRLLAENNCSTSVGTSTPKITIFPKILQVWEDDGYDENYVPINPRFVTNQVTISVTNCGQTKTADATLLFNNSGAFLNFQESLSFKTCSLTTVSGSTWPAEIIFETSPDGYFLLWTPRYRRRYNDWTLREKLSLNLTFYGRLEYLEYWQGPYILNSFIDFNFQGTCRKPATDQLCFCFDENIHNLVLLEELDSYNISGDSCEGRPIDIDVVCDPDNTGETAGDVEIEDGFTMYFFPDGDTVPVINNIAYDTIGLPSPPAGKFNCIKIHQTTTRNEMRDWVCKNIKFATVRLDWRTNPVVGVGEFGDGFSGEENINFNWPYTDLYFSTNCENGNSVQVVPC